MIEDSIFVTLFLEADANVHIFETWFGEPAMNGFSARGHSILGRFNGKAQPR